MTLKINVTHGEAVIIHAGAVISMLHLVPAISCDDNPQVGMLFLAWRNLKQSSNFRQLTTGFVVVKES